jgi:hypothetical protein
MKRKKLKSKVPQTVVDILDARAVAAAKKNAFCSYCVPQTFHMQARLILMGADGMSQSRFLARVPCIITTVPETPEAVICEDHVYTLRLTYPLTYVSVLAARAKRI